MERKTTSNWLFTDAELYFRKWNREPCVYCGEPGTTLDHIFPSSLGGGDEPENLALCCDDCNQKKANLTLLEFLNMRDDIDKNGTHIWLRRLGLQRAGAPC